MSNCIQLFYMDVINSLQWRHNKHDGVSITSVSIVYWTVCSGQITEYITAPRHWPLWGEFTGDRWIPHTKDNTENASILWRHHVPCPNPDAGPCITNVFATRRKNFSQWHRSFQRKLRSHWLKFLRHVAITLVIQGPGYMVIGSMVPKPEYVSWTRSIPLAA